MFLSPKVTAPSPGDFAVCSVAHFLGLADMVGEALDLDPLRAAKDYVLGRGLDEPLPPWRYGHAFVYLGANMIVQAEPGGAASREIKNWDAGHKYILWSSGLFDLTAADRGKIVSAAMRCADKKVPYSVADYLALTTHRLHIPAPGLRDFIKDSGHMICSQLVDWCWQQAPYKLFDDDRWNGYVTPADLAKLLVSRAVASGSLPPPRWAIHPRVRADASWTPLDGHA